MEKRWIRANPKDDRNHDYYVIMPKLVVLLAPISGTLTGEQGPLGKRRKEPIIRAPRERLTGAINFRFLKESVYDDPIPNRVLPCVVTACSATYPLTPTWLQM